MRAISLFCVAAAVLLCTITNAAATKLNVLFFASDDARVQMHESGPGVIGPGCVTKEGQGCAKMHTPGLDKLASNAMLFHKNYVQQAVCSPTRTSLLTSRRPDATRVWDLYTYFRDAPGGGNYTTLPEMFRLNGYETIGMGKIFHPGHASGAGSPSCSGCSGGDDLAHSWTKPYFHAPNEPYPPAPYDGPYSYLNVDPEMEKKYPLSDTQIADHALEVFDDLETRDDDTPFFLAVGFHRPHLPFVAPSAMYDLYDLDSIELPRRQIPPAGMPLPAWSNSGELFTYGDVHHIANKTGLEPNQTLPETKVRELRRAYYAAYSHMDSQLERVLDRLLASKFANNTVISFWGDHGWQLGELGEWCKHTNFELATHAPMLIRVPGVTDGGKHTMSYSNHIDLMPTLAEVAIGMEMPPCPTGKAIVDNVFCTMGKSLAPILRNASAVVNQAAFSQYPRGRPPHSAALAPEQVQSTPSPSLCLHKACIMGYSVITFINGNEWRYTEWVEFNGEITNSMAWNKNYGTELYDMTHEGPEPSNNYAGHPNVTDIQAELRTMLHAGPPPSGWGPYVPEAP